MQVSLRAPDVAKPQFPSVLPSSEYSKHKAVTERPATRGAMGAKCARSRATCARTSSIKSNLMDSGSEIEGCVACDGAERHSRGTVEGNQTGTLSIR
jgi:hypothetical protein